MHANATKWFVWTVIGCVGLSAAYGLYLSGSPSQERARKLDAQRVNDLQQITYAVDQYWAQKSSLPETLDELRSTRDIYLNNVRDPETAQPYEYHRADADSYQVCANFTTAFQNDMNAPPTSMPYPMNTGSTFWNHPIGIHCFDVDVRKPEPTPIVKPL